MGDVVYGFRGDVELVLISFINLVYLQYFRIRDSFFYSGVKC